MLAIASAEPDATATSKSAVRTDRCGRKTSRNPTRELNPPSAELRSDPALFRGRTLQDSAPPLEATGELVVGACEPSVSSWTIQSKRRLIPPPALISGVTFPSASPHSLQAKSRGFHRGTFDLQARKRRGHRGKFSANASTFLRNAGSFVTAPSEIAAWIEGSSFVFATSAGRAKPWI